MWALGTKLALFPFFISHFISQKKKSISLKFSRQNHTLKLKKKKSKKPLWVCNRI